MRHIVYLILFIVAIPAQGGTYQRSATVPACHISPARAYVLAKQEAYRKADKACYLDNPIVIKETRKKAACNGSTVILVFRCDGSPY